jgi:hypothetical protein
MIWRLVSSVSFLLIEIGWKDLHPLSAVTAPSVEQPVRRELISAAASSLGFGGILVALLLDARTLLLDNAVIMHFEPAPDGHQSRCDGDYASL